MARLFCSRHIRHQKSGITGSLRLVSGPRRTCKWLSYTGQSTLGCTVRLKSVNFRFKGDTVIRRSKTPPSQRFCPKRGLIPEFFPFQGLLVLGEVWVWNSRKGPYKWSYSKHLRYYFSVRYFISKNNWKLLWKPRKSRNFSLNGNIGRSERVLFRRITVSQENHHIIRLMWYDADTSPIRTSVGTCWFPCFQ